MGNWGFKFGPFGYDVLTTNPWDLIFTSAKSTHKILATGTATISIPAASSSGGVAMDLPVDIGVDGIANYMPAGVATAIINGKRYRTNMPALFSSVIASPNDEHDFLAFGTTTADDFLVQFSIGRRATSSTAGTNETFIIRYFLLAEKWR